MIRNKTMSILVLLAIFVLATSCTGTKFETVESASTKPENEILNSETPIEEPQDPQIPLCNMTTHEMVASLCLVKCGANQTRNAQRQCVNNPPVCNSTTHEMVSNQCLAKCGTNQTRNAQLQCVNNPPVCNLSTHEMVSNQCLVKCAANQTRNTTTLFCQATQCSNGTTNFPACNDCGAGRHLSGGVCISSRRNCESRPAGTFGGYEEWLGTAWSTCRNPVAATCTVPATYSWGGGCRASNTARTLAYGEQISFSNTAAEANSGSITLECSQSSQQNGYASVVSESCDVKPVYEFHRLDLEYGGPIQRVPDNQISSAGVKGRLLESGEQVYFSNSGEVAYAEDITARNAATGNWLNAITSPFTNPDVAMPTQARLVECARGQINNCRTHNIAVTNLEWSISSTQGDASSHSASSNWLCFDAGRSVSDKRGLIDCGARGSVAIMLSAADGTIRSTNTRGHTNGRFTVRAAIKSSTPGFGNYAGAYGEYPIDLENRIDIKLTSNMTEITGYGRMIHWINVIGENGLSDSATLQSKSCRAITDAGVDLPIDFETYNGNNQFSIRASAVAALPAGTHQVKITCTAATYGSTVSASDATYVRIIK